MPNNFARCLDVVLSLEPTTETSRLGFTQKTWQQWCGVNRPVTLADVLALTRADVEPAYGVFWRGCNANYLTDGVDLCVFDWCVNESVPVGNSGLQAALCVRERTEVANRVVGPVTIKEAVWGDPLVTIDMICDERIRQCGDQARDRVEVIRSSAKAMAAAAQEAA